MIPAVFSVAGITLVVGQQIPAEILQPKITGTALSIGTVLHSIHTGKKPRIVSLTEKQECVYTD